MWQLGRSGPKSAACTGIEIEAEAEMALVQTMGRGKGLGIDDVGGHIGGSPNTASEGVAAQHSVDAAKIAL